MKIEATYEQDEKKTGWGVTDYLRIEKYTEIPLKTFN